MNWTAKILLTVLVAGLIVAVALWMGRIKPAPAIVDGGTADPNAAGAATNRFGTDNARPTNRIRHAVPATAGNQTNSPFDWRGKTEEILGSKDAPAEQGRKLYAMFGHYPPESQAETAQHIANLLADEDYLPFGMQMADTNTLPEVQNVIYADLLNRPNKIKLPVLLEVAKTPDHPKAAETKEMLELYLDTDYGNNWDTWATKVNEWLEKNPDTQ